jgi:hypothetical protein
MSDKVKGGSWGWFGRHTIMSVIGGIVLLVIIGSVISGNKTATTPTATTTPTQAKSTPTPTPTPTKPAPKASTRQVKGTAVTLGAGTFTGGKDVAVGLYDVTAGAGQSGNFSVTGTDSYNEILGPSDASLSQVPMIRAQISLNFRI